MNILNKFKNKVNFFYDKYKVKDYEAILDEIWRFLDTPIFVESFSNLFSAGIDAYEKQNYYLALKCFSKAYALKPLDQKVIYNYALTNQKLGQNDEAIKLYVMLLKTDKKNADVHYNLGLVYDCQRRYEKAIEHFEKSYNIKEDKSCLISMAYAYCEIEKFEEAFETIFKVIDPNDYKTLEYVLDLAYANEKKFNLTPSSEKYINFAIKLYERILLFDKNNYNALFQNAQCYSKLANWNKAAKYCFEALKIMPESFDANYHMGIILFYDENIDEAINYFGKAIEIGPSYSEDVYLSLSYAYEKLNMQKEAIDILLSATKVFKSSNRLILVRKNLKRLINI